MIFLAFLVALLLASTATGTTLTPFTYELSAVDPVVWFQPRGPRTKNIASEDTTKDNTPWGGNSVSPELGWELSYSGVALPLADITKDTTPVGTPKRTTRFPRAIVGTTFWGTGVVMWGTYSNTTGGVEAWLNGRAIAMAGTVGVLVNITNLPLNHYDIHLKLQSGSMEFHSATIHTMMKTDGITVDKVNVTTVPAVIGAEKEFNPVFIGGENSKWFRSYDWGVTVWHHIKAVTRAELTYSVPANTSWLALYGGTSSDNGDYDLSFTPAAWKFGDPTWTTRGSQYSLWRGQDVILWAGPLDPATKYDMKFQALLDYWQVAISEVRIWSALDGTGVASETDATTEKKSSSNIGTIAGGAAGGIAAVVAIALLLLFLRRRRSRDENSSKPQPLDLLDGDMHEYQPHSLLGHNLDTPPVGEQEAILTPFLAAPVTAGSEGANASASASPSGDGDDTPQLPMSAKHGFAPRPKVTRQDTDAGAVATSPVTDAGEDVDMVPPSYDPQWAPAESGSRA